MVLDLLWDRVNNFNGIVSSFHGIVPTQLTVANTQNHWITTDCKIVHNIFPGVKWQFIFRIVSCWMAQGTPLTSDLWLGTKLLVVYSCEFHAGVRPWFKSHLKLFQIFYQCLIELAWLNGQTEYSQQCKHSLLIPASQQYTLFEWFQTLSEPRSG